MLLLAACSGGRHEHRQQQLAQLQAMNQADSVLTDDSLAQTLADYFDRHGTPNEQMEAHYLLGRTHADRGEAPAALAAYHDAIDRADTTAADCDYHTLASIYGQMGALYGKQLLLSNEINALRRASHYDFLAKDTLYALLDNGLVACAYILQNKNDSAETLIRNTMNLYQNHGFMQNSIQASLMLMHIYCESHNRLSELKSLIDKYDSESTYFDENHELHSSHRQFYYYKGRYFEGVNQLDSAEYYFRKINYPNMPYTAYDSMYRGLLSVFEKKRNADSIVKYARLYCEVNDSSIAIKDQELTARMTASYNYSIYQKKSAENAKKANVLQSYVIALLVVIIIGVIFSALLLHRHYLVKQEKQRIIERTKAEMDSLTREYEGKLSQLRQLETSHKKRIETIQKELGNAKEKNMVLLSQNKGSQEIINNLNMQFEEERNNLLQEINSYASKVGELERQLKISAYKKNSMPFLNTAIVMRIKEYYTKDPNKKISEEELKSLVKVTNDYFPDLISDLNNAPGISSLGIHVCLLVALNIQPGDIVHLLDISSAQVGNLKKDLNNALFSENTAKTLYKNLTTHYKIMSS